MEPAPHLAHVCALATDFISRLAGAGTSGHGAGATYWGQQGQPGGSRATAGQAPRVKHERPPRALDGAKKLKKEAAAKPLPPPFEVLYGCNQCEFREVRYNSRFGGDSGC